VVSSGGGAVELLAHPQVAAVLGCTEEPPENQTNKEKNKKITLRAGPCIELEVDFDRAEARDGKKDTLL